MAQDTLMLVEAFRILPLLVRDFRVTLTRVTPVHKNKALPALVPAIAGLATIAV